jgi:biopolymer transport protein ExbD
LNSRSSEAYKTERWISVEIEKVKRIALNSDNISEQELEGSRNEVEKTEEEEILSFGEDMSGED